MFSGINKLKGFAFVCVSLQNHFLLYFCGKWPYLFVLLFFFFTIFVFNPPDVGILVNTLELCQSQKRYPCLAGLVLVLCPKMKVRFSEIAMNTIF